MRAPHPHCGVGGDFRILDPPSPFLPGPYPSPGPVALLTVSASVC